ncbi:MAG: citrate synthase/methylcitrate synthase [Spirochaetota bacterium]|nr:citrate synthase/methylcitrate synthase [Spirochaetota bacterium]
MGSLTSGTDAGFSKGLDGVIACKTRIGYIVGDEGKLLYRGIPIEVLAEKSTYEETAYLLIFGKLPTSSELEAFKKRMAANRAVPGAVIDILKKLPRETHPMVALRFGVSALGCMDAKADDTSLENATDLGCKIISQIPTIASIVARLRKNLEPVDPDPNLGHAANFLYMMLGKEPDKKMAKIMDIALILHADHGMNASTFTAMVIASTLSDMYSAISGGIGALKGPLHGGANERALNMLIEIGTPERAGDYVRDAIANKRKIMGFGHRVYKAYDPRARILAQISDDITRGAESHRIYDVAKVVEKEVIDAYGSKGIFPNVDFYSGSVYHAMGIDPKMFTVIFAVSRVAGWVARILEYLPENRIFRPRAMYDGPELVEYTPLDSR